VSLLILSYSKELELRYNADVIVAGGGPAGFAAAVMCARQGRSVILVEQSGSVGGASVLAGVAEFMNFDDGKSFLCKGIGREVFELAGYRCRFEREWYNIHTEKIKRIYDSLLEEAGVTVLFYNRVTDVVCTGRKADYLVLSGPEGVCAAKSDYYVDTTGNGSLCALSGAGYDYGDELGNAMSTTLCSLWGGVDFKRKPRDANYYEEAYSDGIFSQYDSVLPGIKANHPNIGVGRGNVGHVFGVDDRSTESLTNAMFSGRKSVAEYERYYREYVPGCENAELISTANYLGIRESRRIHCEYTLTMDSFYESASFPDEIGRYSYPVDIHPMTADTKGMEGFEKAVSLRHSDGESYSIPLRCLIPKDLDNVFVAGRCIGADRAMQASTRVIPCCFITGQAAGVAAAVCAQTGARAKDTDVSEVRKRLGI